MQNSFGYLKHTLLKVSIVLRLSSDKLILASIRAACVYICIWTMWQSFTRSRHLCIWMSSSNPVYPCWIITGQMWFAKVPVWPHTSIPDTVYEIPKWPEFAFLIW